MTSADEYRVKAAELDAQARLELNPDVRGELRALGRSYIRLAEQADRNSLTDVVYETPPPQQRKAD